MEAESSALHMWKNPFNQLAESNKTVQPSTRPLHSVLGQSRGRRHGRQTRGPAGRVMDGMASWSFRRDSGAEDGLATPAGSTLA